MQGRTKELSEQGSTTPRSRSAGIRPGIYSKNRSFLPRTCTSAQPWHMAHAPAHAATATARAVASRQPARRPCAQQQPGDDNNGRFRALERERARRVAIESAASHHRARVPKARVRGSRVIISAVKIPRSVTRPSPRWTAPPPARAGRPGIAPVPVGSATTQVVASGGGARRTPGARHRGRHRWAAPSSPVPAAGWSATRRQRCAVALAALRRPLGCHRSSHHAKKQRRCVAVQWLPGEQTQALAAGSREAAAAAAAGMGSHLS
eukprot:COSAG01_NODE_1146_length_11522_cov_103.027916_7_plen_264_part_00